MKTKHLPALPRTRAKQSHAALREKIRKVDRLVQAQLTTHLRQKNPYSKFRLRAIDGTFVWVYLEGPTLGVKVVIGKTKETMRLGAAKRLLRILRYWNPRLPARIMKGLVPPKGIP
jgi:hypothetical protein